MWPAAYLLSELGEGVHFLLLLLQVAQDRTEAISRRLPIYPVVNPHSSLGSIETLLRIGQFILHHCKDSLYVFVCARTTTLTADLTLLGGTAVTAVASG